MWTVDDFVEYSLVLAVHLVILFLIKFFNLPFQALTRMSTTIKPALFQLLKLTLCHIL